MATSSSFKLTYATMFNPPEKLHIQFEQALIRLKTNLGQEHGMLIAGKERFSTEKVEDRSPANTDLVLGVFQKGTAKDANDAVAAARQAFPAWSHTKWQDRVALIRKAADLMDQRIYDIGVVMAMEVGKNRMEKPWAMQPRPPIYIRYACRPDGSQQRLYVRDGSGSVSRLCFHRTPSRHATLRSLGSYQSLQFSGGLDRWAGRFSLGHRHTV